MQAIILANGSFPKKKLLIQEILDSKNLVVCDGAIKHLTKIQKEPNVIIGDLDSISPQLKKKFFQKIIHIKEQDTNDLTKAFNYCITKGFKDIVIFGATGKREDHTLANIFLLHTYSKKVKKVCIKSDFGIFEIYTPPCNIPSKKGQQISIFCLDATCKLTSKGLKYPLYNLALTSLEQGTLNEALGENFSINASKPTQIIIYKTL
ncbi:MULTISPECIES: thiamine diphosphokinase [unclassified Helicobacter]|uniref:thiamine diphosphokinase n=1 Tax=unclassified Helicobacter TaxID=2593540 RepID=UPI000CF02108|nr:MULTISPECIES: thiamine diphosphokinase [unclassified Helicobacter]